MVAHLFGGIMPSICIINSTFKSFDQLGWSLVQERCVAGAALIQSIMKLARKWSWTYLTNVGRQQWVENYLKCHQMEICMEEEGEVEAGVKSPHTKSNCKCSKVFVDFEWTGVMMESIMTMILAISGQLESPGWHQGWISWTLFTWDPEAKTD